MDLSHKIAYHPEFQGLDDVGKLAALKELGISASDQQKILQLTAEVDKKTGLAQEVKKALPRAVGGMAELAGKAVQGVTGERAGAGLRTWGEEVQGKYQQRPEFRQEHPVISRGLDVVEGAAPIAAVHGAALLSGPAAPYVEAVALPALYGTARYQSGVESGQENGLSYEDARRKAMVTGGMEAGMFAGMGPVGRLGRSLLPDVAPTAGRIATDLLAPSAKKAGRNVLATVAVDAPYMGTQRAAISGVEQATGLRPDADPLGEWAHGIPDDIMAGFLFGAYAQLGQRRQARKAAKTLADPTAPMEERLQVAQRVADYIKQHDPTVADQYYNKASAQIRREGTIPVAEGDFLRGAEGRWTTERLAAVPGARDYLQAMRQYRGDAYAAYAKDMDLLTGQPALPMFGRFEPQRLLPAPEGVSYGEGFEMRDPSPLAVDPQASDNISTSFLSPAMRQLIEQRRGGPLSPFPEMAQPVTPSEMNARGFNPETASLTDRTADQTRNQRRAQLDSQFGPELSETRAPGLEEGGMPRPNYKAGTFEIQRRDGSRMRVTREQTEGGRSFWKYAEGDKAGTRILDTKSNGKLRSELDLHHDLLSQGHDQASRLKPVEESTIPREGETNGKSTVSTEVRKVETPVPGAEVGTAKVGNEGRRNDENAQGVVQVTPAKTPVPPANKKAAKQEVQVARAQLDKVLAKEETNATKKSGRPGKPTGWPNEQMQAFIRKRVEQLGSMEAAKRAYPDPNAGVHQFARQVAEEIYNKGSENSTVAKKPTAANAEAITPAKADAKAAAESTSKPVDKKVAKGKIAKKTQEVKPDEKLVESGKAEEPEKQPDVVGEASTGSAAKDKQAPPEVRPPETREETDDEILDRVHTTTRDWHHEKLVVDGHVKDSTVSNSHTLFPWLKDYPKATPEDIRNAIENRRNGKRLGARQKDLIAEAIKYERDLTEQHRQAQESSAKLLDEVREIVGDTSFDFGFNVDPNFDVNATPAPKKGKREIIIGEPEKSEPKAFIMDSREGTSEVFGEGSRGQVEKWEKPTSNPHVFTRRDGDKIAVIDKRTNETLARGRVKDGKVVDIEATANDREAAQWSIRKMQRAIEGKEEEVANHSIDETAHKEAVTEEVRVRTRDIEDATDPRDLEQAARDALAEAAQARKRGGEARANVLADVAARFTELANEARNQDRIVASGRASGKPTTPWLAKATESVRLARLAERLKGVQGFDIYPNERAIPEHIKEFTRAKDVEGRLEGFFDSKTGRIGLVADRLSPTRMEEVIRHELTHRGLTKVFGDKLNRNLQQVYERFKAEIGETTDPLTAAEEFIAIRGESIKQQPVTRMMIARARQLLRDMGFRVKWSDRDILSLAARAQRSEGGKGESIQLSAVGNVEVAPNPADKERTGAWEKLDDQRKANLTERVGRQYIKEAFDLYDLKEGKDYTLEVTTGGFLDTVNPSVLIRFEEHVPFETARDALVLDGFIKHQDSVVISDEMDRSTAVADFVKISPTKAMTGPEVKAFFAEIQKAVPEAQGFTIKDNVLYFGNFSDLKTSDFRSKIKAFLEAYSGGDFHAKVKSFRSEFIDNLEEYHGASELGRGHEGNLVRERAGRVSALRTAFREEFDKEVLGETGRETGRTDEVKLSLAAQKYYEQDFKPGIKAVAEGLAETRQALLRTMLAANRGPEAAETAKIIRDLNARRAKLLDRQTAQFEKARQLIDKLPGDLSDPSSIKVRFIDAIQRDQVDTLPPELRPIAKEIMIEQDRLLAEIQKRGRLLNTLSHEERRRLNEDKDPDDPDFLAHYFTGMWERGSQDKAQRIAAELMGNRNIEGTKSFLKQKTYVYFTQGLAAGLKPLYDNPIDMLHHNTVQMAKWIMAHDIKAEMQGKGMLKFGAVGYASPEGWSKIDGAYGTVFGKPEQTGYKVRYFENGAPKSKSFGLKDLSPDDYASMNKRDRQGAQWVDAKREAEAFANQVGGKVEPRFESGLTTMGHWYAPEGAATVLNNLTSQGLRGSAAFRAYLGAANVMNSVQLGFSFFHAGFTSYDAMVSQFAVGLHYLPFNKVKAMKAFAEVPTAAVTNALLGKKMLKGWYNANPDAQLMYEGYNLSELYATGGGRARMDEFYHINAIKAVKKALRQGNYIGAALRAPFAGVEYIAKPLMEYIVPYQKAGVFAHLAKMEIDRAMQKGERLTHEQLREKMSKIVDSVDNRMGQLVYDNLFWKKTFKDLSMASVRSVGWNLGTIREVVGGGLDWVRAAKNLSKKQQAEFTTRMAYIIALPMVTGIMGAMLQYMFTGSGPEDLKDYFFPRTGGTDEKGNPERVSQPTYIKDIFHYSQEPVKTVTNKIHPLLSTIADMLQNQDYYGNKIVGEEDEGVQKALRLAQYGVKNLTPFAISGALKEHERGGGWERKALPFIGITPAPSAVNMTKAEKLMAHYAQANKKIGGREAAEADRLTAKGKIIEAMRKGDQAKVQEYIEDALKKALILPEEIQSFAKEAGLPANVGRFKKLTYEQAQHVMDVATDQEKAMFAPLLAQKVRTKGATLALRRAALEKTEEEED